MNEINPKKQQFIQRPVLPSEADDGTGSGTSSGANADFLFDDIADFGVSNDGTDGFSRGNTGEPVSTVSFVFKKPVSVNSAQDNEFEKISEDFQSTADELVDGLKSSDELESEKEEKISELQAEIDAATEAYEKAAAALEAELEEIKAEAEEYNNRLAQIDEEISQIDEQINENDNQIAEKDAQIAEKDDAITEKDNAISDKDSQITGVSNQISSIGNDIASLNGQISSLQSRLASLSGSTGDEEADSANASARASIQSRITELQAQKSEKEQKKSALEAKKSDLEAEKDRLQSEKEKLQMQKQELQVQKNELETKNDELIARKAPLEEEKAKIEEQKAVLEEKQAQVEQKIEDNENSDNKKLMDEGPSKIQALEQEYDEKIQAAREREEDKTEFNIPEIPFVGEGAEKNPIAGSDLVKEFKKAGEIAEKIRVVDLETQGDIATSAPGNIHTEFGMDENGSIVFQESGTEQLFNEITEAYITALKEDGVLEALGGEEAVEKIIQSAWIAQYADFDSSNSNDTLTFVAHVFNDADRLIAAAKSDPAVLETLKKHTAYADETLTDGLTHYNTNTTYGDDEKIDYSGDVIRHEDGSVHLNNENDDKDYQTTMDELLGRLIEKYSEMSEDEITELFRSAQTGAIENMQNGKNDCPYGTGNNNQFVEDGNNKNWGGSDNRNGDGNVVNMDELVQMTLYYFDKALYNEIIKDWYNQQ